MDVDGALIRDILSKLMSDDHVMILDKLDEPKKDEELAYELNMKETVVRTLLNDLHGEGLVEYERSKNKKTGWYTYIWKKREDKIREYVINYLQSELNRLYRRLEAEENGSIFSCECSRVTFEMALEMNFICPECNKPFMQYKNDEIVSKLKERISEIEKTLERLGVIIDK